MRGKTPLFGCSFRPLRRTSFIQFFVPWERRQIRHDHDRNSTILSTSFRGLVRNLRRCIRKACSTDSVRWHPRLGHRFCHIQSPRRSQLPVRRKSRSRNRHIVRVAFDLIPLIRNRRQLGRESLRRIKALFP